MGKPGEFRTLGIPTIYDRVCQQALLNRLEPIFEPVFDDANFGYRRGRSTKDALRKVRYADDGVITCKSVAEARAAVAADRRTGGRATLAPHGFCHLRSQERRG